MQILKKSVSLSSRNFYIPKAFVELFPRFGLLQRQVYTECDGKVITIKPLACCRCGSDLDNEHIRNQHFVCPECEKREQEHWMGMR